MGLVVIISLLALFDRDLLGDRQRYQQFAAICIAGIVSWAAVILLGMYLAIV
ncbi:hypothetical protein FD25_GL000194 [Levilactobacillus acidifarinae DSM 19394]|uniref:Uncharacterized protein n=2 Tax=Levilactobacillus acidifarinae TaxID=267364 RepID=A0A0R1LN72_9LACO|nr:hypothetical protein FD25_GL000194 [Levilactobacillus acidifarinae DSM 19394]